MERVLSLTTFREDEEDNPSLAYWLSRSPRERLAEVERLRREYLSSLRGAHGNGCPEGLADLCSLLNAKNVDFLIVGGYAVAFHQRILQLGRVPVQIHIMTDWLAA